MATIFSSPVTVLDAENGSFMSARKLAPARFVLSGSGGSDGPYEGGGWICGGAWFGCIGGGPGCIGGAGCPDATCEAITKAIEQAIEDKRIATMATHPALEIKHARAGGAIAAARALGRARTWTIDRPRVKDAGR